MSYQNIPEFLDIVGATFLARLTAVYTVTSGAQAGLNLYAFAEQSTDPTTGIPKDADPGRQTIGSSPPTAAYAIEINNVLLTVPGSTPAGYTNAGPYVEMRQKGIVDGVPVFEFTYQDTFVYLIQKNTNDANPVSPVPAGYPGFIGINGRVVTDASLSTSVNPTYINSNSANFVAGDVGKILMGNGIANSVGNATKPNPLANTPTTITSINSSTQAVMSAAAVSNVTNGTVGIASDYCLATQMKKTQFTTASSPSDVWPDNLSLGNVWMIAERDGGMNSSNSNRKYNEIVNGQFAVCEKVYRGKFVGEDIFGVPIYEARVEPMLWWMQVPLSSTTSSITLEGGQTTATAYSAQVMQYASGTPSDAFQGLNVNLITEAWWMDASGNSLPPPTAAILTHQVDCDSSGNPVFGDAAQNPTNSSATGTHSLTGIPYATTSISLALSNPGQYLVFVTVPGSVSGFLTATQTLDLEVGVQVNSVDYGYRFTVASLINPTATTFASAPKAYGTVTIPMMVTVTTATQTIVVFAGLSGTGTANWSTAQVGSNASGNGAVSIQAYRMG